MVRACTEEQQQLSHHISRETWTVDCLRSKVLGALCKPRLETANTRPPLRNNVLGRECATPPAPHSLGPVVAGVNARPQLNDTRRFPTP